MTPRQSISSVNRITMLCLLLGALLPGCSNRQMYEGLQAGKRGECQKLQEPDRSRCLDSAGVRYEDYRRERDQDVK